ACQRAPEPAAAPPSTTAPVSETTLAPAPPAAQAPEAAPYTIAPAAPAPSRERETTAPRASTRTHTAPAPRETTATRPGSTHSDRVERTSAAEPIDIPTDAPRRAAAEPAPAPEPNRDTLSLAAGTELQLVLEGSLSSATSHVGDPVTARVARATAPDGRIVLPGGTVLKGKVYRADAAGRVKGKS